MSVPTVRQRWLAAGALAVAWAVGTADARLAGWPIDLEVYRAAGEVWRQGHRLYLAGYPYGLGPYLPFTYPPFAAVVLGGLSLLPLAAAWALLTGLGLALLAVTAGLGWRIAPIPVIGWKRLALGVGLGVAAITVEPVQSTIMYGQINLVLMGMVALDCLVATPRWPRGVLLGVAAAIKLTPLVFVLVLLLRRQWGAAATALGTFTAAACVGALALPADSRDYWFHTLLDPDRIGILDTATNQGVRGVLERWGISGSGPWLAGCAVVAVLTLVSTSYLVARGDQLGSLLTTAAGALLLSPISWSHHWVWCVPGLIWLARRALVNGGWAWLTAATVTAIFILAPHHFFPAGQWHIEQQWTWSEQLLGDSYAWVALAVLLAGSVGATRARSEPVNLVGSCSELDY